ncbi:nuclear transport factor 2 family protein [Qipengyuania sp. ASV99]|uniref:nuclear transport factor 2 family protein n=1 Tax=Qipengyuania sp. ASV99 TaxID=3399681 RepID=UPI003A4C5ACB
MDARLQELLDKQAIGEVIQRYCRTLDWLDDAGQASCYWPDAAIEYGFFSGKAEDFLPVVMATERSLARRWHMLSQPLIRFHSAVSASSECYGIFGGGRMQEDGSIAGDLIGGRYLDEWEKRSGETGDEWRISARAYVLDWKSPLTDQPMFEPDPAFPLPTYRIDASGHPAYRAL